VIPSHAGTMPIEDQVMSRSATWILVDLTPSTIVLQLQARAVRPISVSVDVKTPTMHAGRTYRFKPGASR
jgi:hypothetical protein